MFILSDLVELLTKNEPELAEQISVLFGTSSEICGMIISYQFEKLFQNEDWLKYLKVINKDARHMGGERLSFCLDIVKKNFPKETENIFT
jgi:hypothetical protein